MKASPRSWAFLIAPLLLVSLTVAACSGTPATTLKASAPFIDQSVGASTQAVAILVTITNNAHADLAVDPSEFAVRDASHSLYLATTAATPAQMNSIRAAAVFSGMSGVVPMPAFTLRQHDVLTGFLVFEVPQGVHPVDLIFRQSNNDTTVSLPPS